MNIFKGSIPLKKRGRPRFKSKFFYNPNEKPMYFQGGIAKAGAEVGSEIHTGIAIYVVVEVMDGNTIRVKEKK